MWYEGQGSSTFRGDSETGGAFVMREQDFRAEHSHKKYY